MVTATTAKHPLQAGASPRILWFLLWVLHNAPVITLLLVLPILGNRLGTGQPLVVPIAVLLVVGVVAPALTSPVSRALRMRIPGALVPLSWDTDPGPSRMRLGAAAVTTLVLVGVSVYGLSLAEQNIAVTVLGVGVLAGVSAGEFLGGTVGCLTDKLPGWRRELAICAVANGARSLIFATAGLVVGDHPGNALGGVLLGFSVVIIYDAARHMFAPAHHPAQALQGRSLIDALLARFTPAPTLADRHRARRRTKGVAVGTALVIAGVLGLVWAGSALVTG